MLTTERLKKATRPPKRGAISIMASDSPSSAGGKAKPYGRPAAGLDPGAIRHMGTFSVAAISKSRVA